MSKVIRVKELKAPSSNGAVGSLATGYLTITTQSHAAFQHHMIGTPVTVVPTFATVLRTGVGQRCFLADDSRQRGVHAHTCACDSPPTAPRPLATVCITS